MQYSLVSEAWARGSKHATLESVWPGYSVTLGALAGTVALAAFAVCYLISEVRPVAESLSIAVLLGIYRSGTRYYWLALGAARRVILSDCLGILGLVVAFVILQHQSPITQVASAWALSTVASVAILGFPVFERGSGPSTWLRARSRDIKPLLADSILMDVGAIGTPFLLAGFMGPEPFGIYRAIANAAMPVRLLVDPLRPALGRLRKGYFFRGVPAIGLACAAVLIVTGSYFGLSWLVPRLPYRLGTLSSLEAYAAPAAVFAGANLVGTIFYISCRTNAQHHEIMVGRIFQTVVVVFMPLGGFVFFGVSGAIWGFSLSALISGIFWVILAAGWFPWANRETSAC